MWPKAAFVIYGNRSAQIHMPECRWIGRGCVRVEGIHAVILSGDIDDVESALIRNVNLRYVQGLRIDLPVHGVGDAFAELTRVDVRRCKGYFLKVRAFAGIVVVIGQYR